MAPAEHRPTQIARLGRNSSVFCGNNAISATIIDEPASVPSSRQKLLAKTCPLCGCMTMNTVIIAVRGCGNSRRMASHNVRNAALRTLKM
ncbi:hypothetical protein D3C81_591510 [compost metagenome]